MDETTAKRRRFLEGISVGGGMLLAGCTDQLDLGGESGTAAQADDDASVGSVAAIANVDQKALQEEQVALQEELQNGNITQEEAQEEFAEIREEYLNEAIDALTGTVAETSGADVDEEYRSFGAVVVSGEPAALLSLVNAESVRALVSTADVEESVGTETETQG
jgi:hypothetical protein